MPSETAGHKSSSAKGDRGISSKESAFVLIAGKTFLPIGTPICKRCKEHLVELMKDFSVETSQENIPCGAEAQPDSVVSEIVSPSETQSSECSEQEMEELVNVLK